MYMDAVETSRLFQVIKGQGLSKRQASQLVSHLRHREKHHGIESVVAFLKNLQADLVGDPVPGIRKHCNGEWYGPFRIVWRLAQKRRAGLVRALRILKIHGRWNYKKVPLSKYRDYAHMIEFTEPPEKTILSDLRDELISKLTKEDLYLSHQSAQQAHFACDYPAGNSHSPDALLKSKEREVMFPSEHVDAALKQCPRLISRHYGFISSVVVMPDMPKDTTVGGVDVVPPADDTVGIITPLTKDGSMKVRFVANPLMLLQHCMSRLKQATRSILENCPESNVFDQDAGEKWAQKQLQEGYALSSIDLKSCSDLLPADPQFDLLQALMPQLSEDINLFRDVSRARWQLRSPTETRKVSWTIGQPLGTDPSFFSFTIFLIHVVRSAGGDATSFRVIGDDLIVRSDLTDAVVQKYEALKAPINFAKSIFNKRFGEFAGRFVDVHGRLPVYKAQPGNIFSDPFGLIRQYGHSAIRLLPVRYRKMIETLFLFPEPIGLGIAGSGLLKRLPNSTLNRLYGDKVKKIDNERFISMNLSTVDYHLGPTYYYIKGLLWEASLSPYESNPKAFVSKVLDQIDSSNPSFNQVGLSSEARHTLRGVSTWLMNGLRPWSAEDHEAIRLINELVPHGSQRARHEPILLNILESLRKAGHSGEASFKEEKRKRKKRNKVKYQVPLGFLTRVWHSVKAFFT